MIKRPLAALTALVLCLGCSAALAARPAPASPKKRVVVMVGLPGSGKSTLANRLSLASGAPHHTCGDVIRGWIKSQGLPYTPGNDRMASQHFASQPGEIARQLAIAIKGSPRSVHIVDGVRSVHDMKVLRESFDVRVVALSVPRAERYRRLIARKRFADEDAPYLRARDRREIGLGALHVLRKPFCRIDNSGPLSALDSIAQQLNADLQRSW